MELVKDPDIDTDDGAVDLAGTPEEIREGAIRQAEETEKAAEERTKTEESAGTYIMFQFENPSSVNYRIVASTPPPHPLALRAALSNELLTGDAVTEFFTHQNIASQLSHKVESVPGVACGNCGTPAPETALKAIMANKIAFCPKCHQKY